MKNVFVISAIAMGVISAFSFKENNETSVLKARKLSTASVYYLTGGTCTGPVTCSNVMGPLCVSPITNYYDDDICTVISQFKYRP